jgi:hypothetical protein
MIRRADRIALATRTGRWPGDPRLGSDVWHVERHFKGARGEWIRLRPVVDSSGKVGTRAILFMRRIEKVYEPVPLIAGVVPVVNDRVPSWNCSLDEAIARITR